MSKKFLLIDDEAEKGWDKVLSAILKNQFGQEAVLVTSTGDADVWRDIEKESYHLIFLDLRFGETDHFEEDFRKFTGYNVLQKLRLQENKNFATPIIIFSASSRIWIVEDLLQAGADSYYIKESPIYARDETFTKQNYLRFLNELNRLNDLSIRRSVVWQKAQSIQAKSASKILNAIIQHRIKEKLNIGYGILFNHQTEFEKKNFFFTNEVMGFVVFWSILEEISKDFYIVDWSENPTNYSWKVRGNGRFFIEDNVMDTVGVPSGILRLFLFSRKNNRFEQKERRPKRDKDNYADFMRVNARQINLSEQIASLLNLKFNWNEDRVKNDFLNNLNSYRNSIDFIHGDARQITTSTIAETFDDRTSFSKCLEMLDFLDSLLS